MLSSSERIDEKGYFNNVVNRVHRGDLREAEALLTAQAVTLNTMFTHLANPAAKTEHDHKLDRYLRLALKAQGQCRATLETLAEIKRPRTVFAQQANVVAHGPQQVNNTVSREGQDVQPTRGESEKPDETNYSRLMNGWPPRGGRVGEFQLIKLTSRGG